ncbi:MAG: Xaa-Pro dipeptidase [Shewanella sp.]|nr:Xaa-Pro dipeptidase [Shewanella sp.]MCF1431237.1 Xaa-Pro dipeptidase [Shewanella sp.]MCF1439215.1 Xaa-Pro dipeptidase [Shewanella sp.]MCF1457334.1 Xaa-Pro dipeptidase [Shewanella sp.]
MEHWSELYREHLARLNDRVHEILTREKLTGLVIHSGQLHRQFLDDMDYPFKVNPHFKAWVPVVNNPNCWLMINGLDKPRLIFYKPKDFWHKVADLPPGYCTSHIDIQVLTKADQVAALLPPDLQDWAYIGEHLDVASVLGFGWCNPDPVMHFMHFYRSIKTPYEQACVRQANRIAAKGHVAAREAFFGGGSEFDIQLAYLAATRQGESDLPYANIIGLNQHAAILHYMAQERKSPTQRHSMLIDAGAAYMGYAADITRTYAFEKNEFHDLIRAMDDLQREVIGMMKVGLSYIDLHLATHEKLAGVLQQSGLATGDAQALVSTGVTRAFFPHGLGHMLGLQVHDVGGFAQDEWGTHLAAPAEHPFLRCTRELTADQVLTIEPGLYIIDCLLAELKDTGAAQLVNWQKVEAFRPFGGIRIEDNVIVHESGIENLTRECGLVE